MSWGMKGKPSPLWRYFVSFIRKGIRLWLQIASGLLRDSNFTFSTNSLKKIFLELKLASLFLIRISTECEFASQPFSASTIEKSMQERKVFLQSSFVFGLQFFPAVPDVWHGCSENECPNGSCVSSFTKGLIGIVWLAIDLYFLLFFCDCTRSQGIASNQHHKALTTNQKTWCESKNSSRIFCCFYGLQLWIKEFLP